MRGWILAWMLLVNVLNGFAQEGEIKSYQGPYPSVGSVIRVDPAFDAIVPPGARLEKLAEGFEWLEGPVWRSKEKDLLFSDVAKNAVYRWREGEGVDLFLKPSGFAGKNPKSSQPGSNGLAIDLEGRLVLCQHGDRRVVRLNSDKSFTTLADRFEGKRFNSPNDLVFHKNGDLYFTDPPWGLPLFFQDPEREMRYTGVFRITAQGKLELVAKDLLPNGIAFSPDYEKIYIAHGKQIVVFDMKKPGEFENRRTFFDVSPLKGVAPDGIKVDRKGNVFTATMGSGVLVLSPEGKHLGTIRTEVPTANCCLGDGGKYLYITAGKYLARIELKGE